MAETIFNYVIYVAYLQNKFLRKWLAKCPGIPEVGHIVLDENNEMYKITNIVWMNSDNTLIATIESLNKNWTVL